MGWSREINKKLIEQPDINRLEFLAINWSIKINMQPWWIIGEIIILKILACYLLMLYDLWVRNKISIWFFPIWERRFLQTDESLQRGLIFGAIGLLIEDGLEETIGLLIEDGLENLSSEASPMAEHCRFCVLPPTVSILCSSPGRVTYYRIKLSLTFRSFIHSFRLFLFL